MWNKFRDTTLPKSCLQQVQELVGGVFVKKTGTQYLSDEISKFLSRREELTDTISQGKKLLYEIEIWFNYHDNLAEVLFEGERIVSYWHKQKWLCGIGSDLSNRAGNIYGEMRQSMEELMHLLTEYVYELEHLLYVLPI